MKESIVWTTATNHFSKLVTEFKAANHELRPVLQNGKFMRFSGWVFTANFVLVLIYPVTLAMFQLNWLVIDKEVFKQNFSVMVDHSYPEIAGYLQIATASVIMAIMAKGSHSKMHFFWFVALAYFVCDDALTIHETVGSSFAQYYPNNWGVRASDFGELTYMALAGAATIILFAYSYGFSEWQHRAQGVQLLVPFGLLVFIAVVVDFVNELIAKFSNVISFAGSLMEDGGELMCMAAIMLLAVAQLMTFGKEAVMQRAPSLGPSSKNLF
jgi:hypothetical protein